MRAKFGGLGQIIFFLSFPTMSSGDQDIKYTFYSSDGEPVVPQILLDYISHHS